MRRRWTGDFYQSFTVTADARQTARREEEERESREDRRGPSSETKSRTNTHEKPTHRENDEEEKEKERTESRGEKKKKEEDEARERETRKLRDSQEKEEEEEERRKACTPYKSFTFKWKAPRPLVECVTPFNNRRESNNSWKRTKRDERSAHKLSTLDYKEDQTSLPLSTPLLSLFRRKETPLSSLLSQFSSFSIGEDAGRMQRG